MAKDDWFERYERDTPEHKLELIDGRLVIGNSLAGSRYYLHDLLDGWGTEAVLPFAAPERWRVALHQAFASFTPPQVAAPLETWQAWARAVFYEPRLAPAGPLSTGPHHRTRERLTDGAWHACAAGRFGTSFGRDFVLHLGNNGFTPDGSLIGRQATERLFERYLNGPADLVWEILLPGHERQDREVKRHAYQAGGVPHYWIIDPAARTIDLLRLRDGQYRTESVDADGRYRPAAVPGLALLPERLWQESLPHEESVFQVEAALPGGWSYKAQDGIDWEDVPFVPAPELEPRTLLFEEFASWCPRAKFEGDGQRTIIGGHRGTRNVLGMLLRTFGLAEVVTLAPPQAWVAGLVQREQAQRNDPERKARWWDLARKAADLLRVNGRGSRFAVIGSLTRPEPLHCWSELLLVVWDMKGGTFDNYDLLRELDPEYTIDLIDPNHATRTQQRMISEEAIDIL